MKTLKITHPIVSLTGAVIGLLCAIAGSVLIFKGNIVNGMVLLSVGTAIS